MLITDVARDYDLAKTLECGQFFRYKKLFVVNKVASGAINFTEWYQLFAGDSTCFVHQLTTGECALRGWADSAYGNPVEMYPLSPSASNPNVVTEGDASFWVSVLSVHEELSSGFRKLMSTRRFERVWEKARGIRLIKQSPWEATIFSVVSQRNNINRIWECVENICRTTGRELKISEDFQQYFKEYVGTCTSDGGGMSVRFYSFPKPQDIMNGSLADCHLGYREQYIYNVTQAVLSGSLPLALMQSKSMPLSQVLSELQTVRGIGPKVASCIALFGLQYTNAFPIDVWIERAMVKYSIEWAEVLHWGDDAGLVQQYLYYAMQNHS